MSGKVAVNYVKLATASSSAPGLGASARALLAQTRRCGFPADLARGGDEARREDDAVQDDGQEEPLDVDGRHVVAAVEERPGPDGALEREAATDGGPDGDALDVARRAHELDRPAADRVVDVDLLDRSAQRQHVVEAERRPQRRQGMGMALRLDDRELVVLARIAERRAQEESVELRLRQWEGALLLDRVLGREDEEGLGQRPRDPVDRHLLLGHRLEQRRLGLRHRAVDLVDEDDVREHRPGSELEVALLLVEDGEAGDVRRLQVWRALDARVAWRRPRCRRSRGRAPSSPCPGRPPGGRVRRRRGP